MKSSIILPSGFGDKITLIGRHKFVGRRADGSIKWIATVGNKIVDEGLNNSLRVYYGFTAATPTINWYLGFTNASPVVAPGDTMADHPGWTENVNYTAATRPAWGPDDPSGLTITNSVVVTITCNQNGSVFGGMFLVNDNSKPGSIGLLNNAGAFDQGNKTLDLNETLDCTLSITAGSLT